MSVQGIFEAIDHYHGIGWFAKGWAFDPDAPEAPVQLVLHSENGPLFSFHADLLRQDLVEGKVGTGKHAFELQLPESLLDGHAHDVQVFVSKDGCFLPKKNQDWFMPQLIRGCIEHVHEGIIKGWVVNQTKLERPPAVDIVIDDQWICSLSCTLERPDLLAEENAKSGGGFSYPIPEDFYDGRIHLVSIKYSNSLNELENSPVEVKFQPRLYTSRHIQLKALEDFHRRTAIKTEMLRKTEPFNWLSDDSTYLGWLKLHEKRIEKAALTNVNSVITGSVKICLITPGQSPTSLMQELANTTEEVIAFQRVSDRVHRHLAFLLAKTFKSSDIDGAYFDEDEIMPDLTRKRPFFKPNWDQDRQHARNFIGFAGAMRRQILLDCTHFLPQETMFESLDTWVTCLLDICFIEVAPNRIRHLPYVLYHRCSDVNPDVSIEIRRQYLQDHFVRNGITATPLVQNNAVVRTRYHLPITAPAVTLIIPTRDKVELLRTCVESILHFTHYSAYKILVVDNNSQDYQTLGYFRELEKHANIRVVPWPHKFNYSRMHNEMMEIVDTDYVGLINNDIEVCQPDWLEELMSHIIRPEVGAVGAKLLFPDGMIQHGGVVVGQHGVADNSQRAFSAKNSGYFYSAVVTQNVSAVTAACLICRRSDYFKVGGMDAENLAVSFNDVDFCLRLRALGKRIIWTPHATLFHRESATRGEHQNPMQREREKREAAFLKKKWDIEHFEDPFYSPNMSRDMQTYVDFRWPSKKGRHTD